MKKKKTLAHPSRLAPVTCIIPAFNEEKTIGNVIDVLKRVPEISEILVVDDGSMDRTSEIVKSKNVRTVRHEMNLGKGAAIKTGARKAKNSLLLFIDADLEGISPQKVRKIIMPLIGGEADFVKASYKNSLGRVTTLVAKPLLKIVYPFIELKQPLSGEFAFDKKKFDLEKVEDGWGVDIQLVFQAAKKKLRIKEVFIGTKEHKHQSLKALSMMSEQIIRTILSEIKLIAHTYKIIFFDLDKTLIKESSIEIFAREWGFEDELNDLRQKVEKGEIPDKEITMTLSRHFRGKTQEEVNEICEKIHIDHFAAKVIKQLRKQRYRVRIVSSAFSPVVQFFASKLNVYDFMCPRIGRDKNKRFTGKLNVSRFEDKDCSCCGMYVCKKKAVDFVRKRFGWKRGECMSVGDGKNDQCMFDASGLSLGYNTDIGDIRIENLSEILMYID